jgi:hypothetical protein
MKGQQILGSVLVLGLLLGLAASPNAPSVGAADPPGGLQAAYGASYSDWWSTVQENIRRSEYHVTWQEQTYLADVPAAYQAPNRAHNLRTYFTPEGPVVIPRLWTEELEATPWRWEVSLVDWGREGALEPVPPAELEVDENLIEYRRGTLLEWYRNDEHGLEQGFTLNAPPEGNQASGQLQLDLNLGGNLLPLVDSDGVHVEFVGSNGEAVLTYGALAATGAEGRFLPVWLAVNGSTLTLFVDDSGATYPIMVATTITGLPTREDWDFTCPQDGAQAGASVATAGDVNRDGYSDAIVGVPNYDGGSTEEGRVYVFYGSPIGLLGTDPWIKESDRAYAHFGFSVATAGDVNGDGYADVIVGAPDYERPQDPQEDEGGAWVYHGSQDGVIDAPEFFAEANVEYAHLGESVATAGDVNGDGYADIIIGVTAYSQGEEYEGGAFVWHGSEDGVNDGDYFGTFGNADWMAESNQGNARMGTSVATAGDVNGDGYADVIVGAHNYTDGTSREGAAFVWHGHAITGVNNGLPGNPDNPAWIAQSNNFEAYMGSSVSTAGDVNGDGYADVIVGASHYSNPESDEGAAWLYLGSDSGLNSDWANMDEGNQAGAWFGRSVATAGDVNGDGYADVIVGAPFRTNGQSEEGEAYVWYGDPSSGISSIRDWDDEGERVEAWYGWSVATAGDVNGDGYSDIIVGAPGVLDQAGRAYAYYGSAGSLEETATWTKASNLANALYGYSVGTAGDVNGDGYADVIVGSPWWDQGQALEGQAWVYMGQADGLDTVPAWYKPSNEINAQFGASVGTAGDVNGDGFDDVIVGAPGWSKVWDFEGAAFVYPGSSGGLATSSLWSKRSNQQDAEFGTSVGTAGDVNGDGYADIIVGAPFWQSGGEERGAVWLYYGSNGGPHSPPDWNTVGDQEEARYGYAVGTAGDVNADGYSDVIVGAPYWSDQAIYPKEGRAWVYLGSPAGLRYDLHWHAEGNNYTAQLGHSVGTAGDVNGDGYSDVIVGAPGYGDGGLEGEGKVWVFHGSNVGLNPVRAWYKEGGQNGAQYGSSVGTAGDVNGDGYADVIIGIELLNGGHSNEGGASVYHGSWGGLEDTWAWHGESDQASAHYGASVGTAGDVNGDGYAEVIVGAPYYKKNHTWEGQAFLYYGNGGPGMSLRPRQMHWDGGAIAHLGRADDTDRFRIALSTGTPFGRGGVRMQAEVRPLRVPLTGSPTQGWGFYHYQPPGSQFYIWPTDLHADMPYHWQVRWRYDPATTPFMPGSRWVTMPWNGRNEQDLRTGGARIQLPLVLRGYESD